MLLLLLVFPFLSILSFITDKSGVVYVYKYYDEKIPEAYDCGTNMPLVNIDLPFLICKAGNQSVKVMIVGNFIHYIHLECCNDTRGSFYHD